MDGALDGAGDVGPVPGVDAKEPLDPHPERSTPASTPAAAIAAEAPRSRVRVVGNRWFFGGRTRISLQGTWTSEEDSTGEFNASPTATPKDAVFFWEDVYPVRGGSAVTGVPPTAAGLLHWLQSASALKTGAPRQGRIGTLPATVVDVSVNKRTKNEDPNCPDRPCVLFLLATVRVPATTN